MRLFDKRCVVYVIFFFEALTCSYQDPTSYFTPHERATAVANFGKNIEMGSSVEQAGKALTTTMDLHTTLEISLNGGGGMRDNIIYLHNENA